MSLDEPVADSSPAAEPIEVEDLSDSQRDTWTKTGELPAKEIKPSSDDSATSKPAAETSGKIAESGTAPPSKRKNGEDRKAELSSEIQALLEKRSLLKDDALWKEYDDYRKTKGEKKADTPVRQQEEIKEPASPERPKRPRLAEYGTNELYEAAMDQYDEKMLEYPAKKQAYDTVKAQVETQKQQAKEFNQKAEATWLKSVTEAREKYADFDEKALAKDLVLPWGGPVDEWIFQLTMSEQPQLGAELLYYMGTHREELKRIIGLARPAQHRELTKLVDSLSEPESKEKPKEKAKLVSDALPPPREVGGKGTAGDDEEEAALKKGDTDRYIELANKRELAARKAARR